MRGILLILILGIFVNLGAQITPPWTSTYDCNEWQQGQTLNCDGWLPGGSWTCNGTPEMITLAANYPLGSGGRGQRHWLGPSGNANSGGLMMKFSSPQPEIYMKWFIRWENGMNKPSGGYKCLYIYLDGNILANGIFQFPYGDDSFRFYEQGGGHQNHVANYGWISLFGSNVSNEDWVKIELYMKLETNYSNPDGIIRCWVNDVLRLDINYAQFSQAAYGTTGFDHITVGSNSSGGHGGSGCMFIDYDDWEVNTSGPTGSTAPIPPQNPRVTP